ncbi:MAG: FtsX-like permease family protein, partial [Magnetococcales bacterium]|nr:FtsX-like permease family protein [Magnetococcales bacterium]
IRFFRWGPRLIIPFEQVNNTGLLGFGSRVTHVTLIRLPEGSDSASVARELIEETLGTGIRVMTPSDGQMSARRFIDRFTLFMRLLTLLTLLSTGNAMAGAMTAHARENRRQVAILQSLGVGHGAILGIFMLRILLVALPSALVGALLGSGWPLWLDSALTGAGAAKGFSAVILLSGVVGGLLGSLLFSFGALWSLRSVTPMGLFRAVAWSGGGGFLRARWRWGVPLGLVLLAALAVGAQDGWKAGLLLVSGLSGGLLVLTLLARVMLWILGWLQPASLVWRLALRRLTAHGGGTLGSLVSLGLGMATLATMLFLERNIDQQLTERLPERVASFFLLDLQPDQEGTLRELASRHLRQGDDLRITPVVRGRLRALNGEEVTTAVATRHPQAWRFQRDYVLTWAEEPPVGNRIIQGRWWSDSRAMEVSLEREMARDLRLGLGDSVTFSILGVDVTATVTSIRDVAWSDMSLNFFVIFAPAVVEGVPFSHLASIRLDPDREEPFRAEVTRRMNNISLIAAREVMERAREMLERVIGSLRLAGGMAVAAGVIALLVAILLLERGRVREVAIVRLLGARQGDLRQVAWREFWLLGICASGAGVIVGQGIAWAVIRFMLQDRWDWLPGITFATLTGGALLVAGTGYLAARRDLERPIAEALRAHED